MAFVCTTKIVDVRFQFSICKTVLLKSVVAPSVMDAADINYLLEDDVLITLMQVLVFCMD